MKIYNTMTKQKEVFEPIEPMKVRMYVCGPTVYNHIHIGNARPYIIFDTVRRYFESEGYSVNYVQNFTDVDDKIINKANEEKCSTLDLVNFYIKETLEDAHNLNIRTATHHPRVTEEMDEIIAMIQTLIEKKFAYEVNGTVYFKTTAFNEYGKLSKKVLDELEAGSRIKVSEEKENPMDFVLWKPKKENEPYWESPWSDGRPGWHIECSAMSKKYLGNTIDIHAGGEDLVFPHHENEIAQSEAANGEKFSNYWMHNSFLNIDNKKMSKSLGNFKTLREVGEKFGYDVVRFFMLSAHYRSPLNFSGELMEAAANGLNRIKNGVSNLEFIIENAKNDKITEQEQKLLPVLNQLETDFHKAMQDDFNTADAISSMFEVIKFANTYTKEEPSKEFAEIIYKQIMRFNDVLGILYKVEQNTGNQLSDEEIEEYILGRTNAKKERNFAEADRIREFLKENNVIIEDTREGVRYKRV
ncbi:MAG: cysteine--tRNA ligase [Cellulosilyticaceae bacterium]